MGEFVMSLFPFSQDYISRIAVVSLLVSCDVSESFGSTLHLCRTFRYRKEFKNSFGFPIRQLTVGYTV